MVKKTASLFLKTREFALEMMVNKFSIDAVALNAASKQQTDYETLHSNHQSSFACRVLLDHSLTHGDGSMGETATAVSSFAS